MSGASANNMDGLLGVLLCLFLAGATPIAALPALVLCGPGKNNLLSLSCKQDDEESSFCSYVQGE